MKKLIRITTVPISLDKLLSGQMKYMSSFYDVTAVSSDPPALDKIAEKEGVKVFSVEMTRKITPLQDLKAVFKLAAFLRKEKPLIVHTHTPKAGLVGMMAAKMAKVPHRLHTVAGLPLLEAKGKKRQLLDRVEKFTYRCATKVYPNSYGLLEIIKKNNYCRPEKLKVLANGSSNGIDTKHFSNAHFSAEANAALKKSLRISDTDIVFIFVGRLVSDKGLNELAKAFEPLHAKMPQVKLLLVGNFENDLDPLSEATMKIFNQNHGVISAGYQNDVRPYFAISDALIFPSYREGFPNVVMQAGAMDLPAIVSNINGCNEIINEGVNGNIIPVKDAEAIYKAMEKMAVDVAYREKLTTNARNLIVTRYEQQVVWDAIREEYLNFEKSAK